MRHCREYIVEQKARPSSSLLWEKVVDSRLRLIVHDMLQKTDKLYHILHNEKRQKKFI